MLLAELRSGLTRYLATRPGDGPRTLADVVAFNREHADVELARFGQSLFEQALEGPGSTAEEYAAARARCLAPAATTASTPCCGSTSSTRWSPRRTRRRCRSTW